MKRICVECGLKYSYNSNDPRGATASSCPACQKRGGRLKRRWDLLLIAGNGDVQCRCCGYRKYPYAIMMMAGRDFLTEPDDETKARASFLICKNCEAGMKAGDIKMTVRNSYVYPIDVGFHEVNVTVEYCEMEQHIRTMSKDAIEMEVYSGKESDTIRTVSAAHARLEGESSD